MQFAGNHINSLALRNKGTAVWLAFPRMWMVRSILTFAPA